MIQSIAMMQKWIGENRNHQAALDAGNAMELAVDTILSNPESRTADLGGSVGCQAFGELVAGAVHNL